MALTAAHVVADPFADTSPVGPAVIDWEATLAYRRHLWAYGLGVAEAMDTAQRGMGLDWGATAELITRSCAEASSSGGSIVCGANTDNLDRDHGSLEDIVAAYETQCEHIESAGGRIVVMASRHLARWADGPDDYHHVYGRILSGVREPAILHWLGPMFDTALEGYWGSTDFDGATDVVFDLLAQHADRIDGIKISLLDAYRERAFRQRIPAGIRCYTGDDFNFPDLIRGEGGRYSDALLGVFDAIAPIAAHALRCLDADDIAGYDSAFAPTVPLSRHLFAAPTVYYKTGIVFLAYLNVHQDHFRMVGGLESARSIVHLGEIVRLADRAGVLADPDMAANRYQRVLDVAGIGPT
ncbi:dihydrodipicolinate synthase family protein [soil metagenome]